LVKSTNDEQRAVSCRISLRHSVEANGAMPYSSSTSTYQPFASNRHIGLCLYQVVEVSLVCGIEIILLRHHPVGRIPFRWEKADYITGVPSSAFGIFKWNLPKT
jgi:hypothetical protein